MMAYEELSAMLRGQTISELYLAKGEYEMIFVLENGEYVAVSTEGDCCSESWFADIIGVSSLLGGRVMGVFRTDGFGDEEDGRGRQEYDQIYGFAISTNRGVAQVAFRNSSNGYYGGWLNSPTSLLPQYYSLDGYRRILEDFSA